MFRLDILDNVKSFIDDTEIIDNHKNNDKEEHKMTIRNFEDTNKQ